MSKAKYRKLDNGDVEYYLEKKLYTDQEFKDEKKRVKDRIKEIDDEVAALVYIEAPPGSSAEVQAAVADYNDRTVEYVKAGLLADQAALRDQEALMDEVP